jgi:uncharacterized coiled-coil DUF342 family protein
LQSRLHASERPQRRRKDQPEAPEETLARLGREVADTDRLLETTSMPIEDEKKIVEQTRRKRREIDRLKREVATALPATPPEESLPSDPAQIKQEIEQELAEVTRLRQEAQAAHEEAQKSSAEIDALTKEADARHQQYLEHRQRANEIHEKAMKMRELVVAERAKRAAEQQEAKESMIEQAQKVKAELYDEERIAKETDEAVELLRQRGKLTL